MPSFVGDTVSVGISKVLIIAFGLVRTIIIARWLGPEDNGLLAALLVYPSLFMSLGSLGVRQAVTFYVGSQTYSLDAIKAAVVQIWFVSSVFSVLVSYLLIRSLSSGGNNFWLVLFAVLPIPFSLFNTYNTGIFLGLNKIKQFNRVNWLPQLFVLLATIGLVIVAGTGIGGALASAIVGPLIMSGILLWKYQFIQSFTLKAHWSLIGNMLKLGSVYAVALLIINLNYKVDIVLLDIISTPMELGIYSKGAHMMEYMWHIPMVISTIVFARSASAKDRAKFSHKVVQLLQVSFVAVAVACCLLAIIAEWLIVFLFGPDFSASAPVLRVLLPGVLILTIFKVMNMDLAGRGKPWIAIGAMLPALIVNIGCNLVWIPLYGAWGAGLASTISYSISGVIFLLLYCRETEIKIRDALIPKPIELKNVLFQAFQAKLGKS